MEILKLKEEYTEELSKLFNAYAENEFPHRKLSLEKFKELFVTETDKVGKVNIIAVDNGKVIGFANGSYKKQANEVAYITFVLVEKAYRRNKIGKMLLSELEVELKEKAEGVTKLQITFFNPINLEWIVPNTKGHDHPNAPGIDVASEAYIFFKNVGYLDLVYQNSFYLPLENFEIAPQIQERIEKLPENELNICFYDKNRHFGLDELFDDLGNELWREAIIPEAEKENGLPVLIAEHNGKAVGFTGPLYVQESGRGYFAGIGVHSEYRKYGLGKALFSSLCKSLKDMGAGYMTLFTGETNPARKIYQGAGFKIVKTWSDMEKVL